MKKSKFSPEYPYLVYYIAEGKTSTIEAECKTLPEAQKVIQQIKDNGYDNQEYLIIDIRNAMISLHEDAR